MFLKLKHSKSLLLDSQHLVEIWKTYIFSSIISPILFRPLFTFIWPASSLLTHRSVAYCIIHILMYDMQTKQESKYCYIALRHSQKIWKAPFKVANKQRGQEGASLEASLQCQSVQCRATDFAAAFGVFGVRICYLQLSEEEEDKKHCDLKSIKEGSLIKHVIAWHKHCLVKVLAVKKPPPSINDGFTCCKFNFLKVFQKGPWPETGHTWSAIMPEDVRVHNEAQLLVLVWV